MATNKYSPLDSKIFAKNLKFLRKNSGRTQYELAEVLDIPRTKISAWELGRNMPGAIGDYKLITDLFDVDLNDLLYVDLTLKYLEENNPYRKNSTIDNCNRITVYGRVCAGSGFEAFEDPIDEITNPYHRIKGEMFALQVDGDSMDNVVDNGMYAIIQKQPTVNNGEIAVVLIDGDVGMLKRFYSVDKSTVVLKPDSSNPKHKPMMFIDEELNNLRILGKYIGCVSPFETYEDLN